MNTETGKVVTIKVSGEVELHKNADISLQGLQKAVNGQLEIVYLRKHIDTGRGIVMWLNENGRDTEKPSIALVHTRNNTVGAQVLDVVRGNVIITSSTLDGDTVGLTDEEVEFVQSIIIKDLEESLEYGVTTSIKLNNH